jgi:hypothetical protein
MVAELVATKTASPATTYRFLKASTSTQSRLD